MPEQFVYICALPLYHVFALVVNCLFGMRIGTLNVLIANPRDIAGFVTELAKYRFNVLPGVNTLYNALLGNAEFRKLDFSSLRVANGGGMAVQKASSEKWLALTGVPIIEGYGLSETSPVATCNPVLNRGYNGTIGLPFPNTEIAILDDAGQPVPLGQPGEIAIRGPQVMAGYWNRPDETEKVMTPDGFFKSGDVGIMDERGYIRIVDRKKDMILVSGFNVYPNEIEQRHHVAPRRRRVRRGGRARRALRRGGQGVRRAQGPHAHGRAAHGVLPRELHGLQETEVHRVPRRAAEEQRRQDPAARVARRGGRSRRASVVQGVTARRIFAVGLGVDRR